MLEVNNVQKLRESFIEKLDESKDSTDRAKELADELYALDLTVYSKTYTFDSLLYSSFAQSRLDNNIVLQPEQLRIIEKIEKNAATIVSAPTSFGKTFSIFEYIAKEQPNNVALIVPTIALIDEYRRKIIKKYQNAFSEYKVYSNVDENKEYNFDCKNIFILTHDRIVQDNLYEKLKSIDFLVIDEVYKLETDPNDDRVLVLNMAYYYLSKISKKYVLLAPFINSILDNDKLDKKPYFYKTDFSPVVNKVTYIEILNERDRYVKCQDLIKSIGCNQRTLVYFPTVTGIYNYINKYIANEDILTEPNEIIQEFINWAKDEIHEEWSVIKAMERGYLVHNAQIPMGIRMFQLDLFNSDDEYNRLLCTSTLLEGVNTTSENIIITKPSRKSNRAGEEFSAFDFYNLVGRTGRLYQHYVGNAYYIKGPNDPKYEKIDAIKDVRFEISTNSKDVEIQKGNIENYPDVIQFLNDLGISREEYKNNIGSKLRFDNVKKLYERYINNKDKLCQTLHAYIENSQKGKYDLVKVLLDIIEEGSKAIDASIINKLLYENRPKIKTIVNDIKEVSSFKTYAVDLIISKTIKLKNSYIEHEYYPKILIVRYFMEINNVPQELMDVLNKKIISAIERIYFVASKQKKTLMDLGIYEYDIEKIIKVIGDDFDDISELKERLRLNRKNFKSLSFITKYVIDSLT